MKLTAAQKKEQFTVQVQAVYTSTEDLEDALQTWGIDTEEYDNYDELLDALREAVEESSEDIANYQAETDWEIQEISLGSIQLY